MSVQVGVHKCAKWVLIYRMCAKRCSSLCKKLTFNDVSNVQTLGSGRFEVKHDVIILHKKAV